MILIGILLLAQAAFDVATVKVPPPVPLGTPVQVDLGSFRNGTLTLTNATMAECLQFAYALVSDAQITGPDWIKERDTRFNIVAKAPSTTDREGARPMLQALLADRLKVVVRPEKRTTSFLALVPAAGGPKLPTASEAQVATGRNNGNPGRIVANSMPMQVLASLLSRFQNQLVVDKTGLPGRYQFRLEWAAEIRVNGAAAETPGPSLSDALKQLGLRLESRKEPLDAVVVERAERNPSEN